MVVVKKLYEDYVLYLAPPSLSIALLKTSHTYENSHTYVRTESYGAQTGLDSNELQKSLENGAGHGMDTSQTKRTGSHSSLQHATSHLPPLATHFLLRVVG